MVRTNFHFEPDQLLRVKDLAAKTGRTSIDVIRAAIDAYLISTGRNERPIAHVAHAPKAEHVLTDSGDALTISEADAEMLRQRDAALRAQPREIIRDRPLQQADPRRLLRKVAPEITKEEREERIRRMTKSGDAGAKGASATSDA